VNDQTDSQLLRAYAEHRAEPAFAELVRRHVDFVYSAAKRMVCDSHLAEDVTQGVFVALAKQAVQLANCPVLSGWLHGTTWNIAAQTVRTDVRRRAREQEAVAMNELIAGESEAGWEQIAPHLDVALGELGESDRDALLLRYFERKSAQEMALIFGISDEAAQKRVSRAVEKLREFFSTRKITIGTSGLVVLISAKAVQAAPIGLALTIANASLAAGTTLTYMKIATATKLKLAFGAIVVASAVTAFVFQQQNQTKLRGENESLQQQLAQLQADNANLSNRIAEIGEVKKLSAEQFNELLKLRGEVGVLRRQLGELTEKNRALQDVNASMSDSNTNPPAPQIHIKARFLTMPNDVLSGLGGAASFNGILTSENASNVLRQLRLRDGVETLAEPEVILISGHQVQMRATQVISIMTNFCLQETNGISSIVPQTENVETGPVLDAMPRVLPDGYTIELPVTASVVEFLGYAQSTNTTPAYNSAGKEMDVPTVSPQFRMQSTTNSVNLFDDQTLVFGLKDNQVQTDAALAELDGGKSNSLNRQTLVFVTATIIDAAGNRVHEDTSYTNIPPQAAE
jgi:RNA polymerase sigma factor (sigma-70 family)